MVYSGQPVLRCPGRVLLLRPLDAFLLGQLRESSFAFEKSLLTLLPLHCERATNTKKRSSEPEVPLSASHPEGVHLLACVSRCPQLKFEPSDGGSVFRVLGSRPKLSDRRVRTDQAEASLPFFYLPLCWTWNGKVIRPFHEIKSITGKERCRPATNQRW